MAIKNQKKKKQWKRKPAPKRATYTKALNVRELKKVLITKCIIEAMTPPRAI